MSMASTQNDSRWHLLLTAMGTQPKPTTYALGDKTTQAAHAPLAWLQLQDANDWPDKVLCLFGVNRSGQSGQIYLRGPK